MSTSRTPYMPRWSNQATEQMLSRNSFTPSPPPIASSSPDKEFHTPPSSPPPRKDTDSPYHSAPLNIPNQENQNRKNSNSNNHDNDGGGIPSSPILPSSRKHELEHEDIPRLWSQLSQQLPTHDKKKKSKTKMMMMPSRVAAEPEKARKHGNTDDIEASPSPGYRLAEHNDKAGIVYEQEAWWSVGMFLFWFGFLCPLFWWVGSFWPRHADRQGKLAHRWQILNRVMSISFCILLGLLLIGFGVWYHFAS